MARPVEHGMIGTPEYEAYNGAKQRCTNPKSKGWKYYGARGIQFRFESFVQFLLEIGPRPSPKHSLDRKENDGHYEADNVRWATKKEQMANRRYKALCTFSTAELVTELKLRGITCAN